MREFPQLVQLHEKHAKDGVVCMSVSVDKAYGNKSTEIVLDFLVDKHATVSNYYMLDTKNLEQTWRIDGYPLVRVYNRAGKKVDDYHSYEEVNEAVDKLLAAAE